MLKLSISTMLKMMNEDQKPSVKEIAAALTAATEFIERATEEPNIQTVLDEVRKLALESNNRDACIDEKITHIKCQTATSTGSIPSDTSYANVLGRASTAFSLTSTMSKQSQTLYNRMNEITIRLQDENADKALKGKTPQKMTEMVNDYIRIMDPKRKFIRTVRRLESGDICVMATNEEEANSLREHKEWMQKLSDNARAVTRTFGLLLHGVRIRSIDGEKMAWVIEIIQRENANTLSLDIAWIGWLDSHKEGQERGSLIIELTNSEQGNRALEKD